MAPFTLDGTLKYAGSVIQDLGDFRSFRSPSKCAARIGQAFSQILTSVVISPDAISQIPDVKNKDRVFSDGVGTCSRAILQRIWDEYRQAHGLKPTILQIQFQGAKGVISLDSRLEGYSLRLRKSMIKFEGSKDLNIEICGAGLRPLPMYLNRQLIKILEDLQVPGSAFLQLQAEAVEELRKTTLSAINAASFFERNNIGKRARLLWLIRKLWAIDISFNDDDFLRNALEFAVLIRLREIKYRTRIRVSKGVTLYGIMDETAILKEGEIYCSVRGDKGGEIMTGDVIITRSPALHPGDIQSVKAVDVPSGSALRDLHNVVVFSSMGERDLPSQLSGGDLDGDLYNVIYDHSLYPKSSFKAADYPIVTPIDIGRPVERQDMANFFVSFMENDALGRIATLHQTLADQKPLGTLDESCILLAGLHSTAVDFAKTGIPADLKLMPKSNIRPDFQAPSPRVLIEKGIALVSEDDRGSTETNDEVEEVAAFGPPKTRYYESQKILGKLYRAIDEHKFFEQIQEQSRSAKAVHMTVLDALWHYVEGVTTLIEWQHCINFASDIKESYEDNLLDTMFAYSTHPSHPVSEVEVFCGSILGKNGAQNYRQRESSKTMKDKYERDVAYYVRCILHGSDGEDSGEEALERSIACLFVAITRKKVRKNVGTLVSFAWIAGTVCLGEVEKLAWANGLHR